MTKVMGKSRTSSNDYLGIHNGNINIRWYAGVACVLCLALATGCRTAQQTRQQEPTPASYVNPFIGTGTRKVSSLKKVGWGRGATYPGAVVPWGMVSVSPMTALTSNSGFVYGKPWLYGFGHVHLSGTGCYYRADLGSVVLMPTVGPVYTRLKKNRSHYSQQKASPGYYTTILQPSGIKTEMSATTRSGISKYTFPSSSGEHNILLNASFTLNKPMMPTLGHIKIVSPTEMEGWTQSGGFCDASPFPRQTEKIYFVAKFSTPADSMGTWGGTDRTGIAVSSKRNRFGRHVGAYFRYNDDTQQTVYVKVGISYVSIANARANLQAEQPGWNFDHVRKQARRKWNNELSRIQVQGGTKQQKTIFYTGLYHMLLQPNTFSDVNGEYLVMGHDGVAKVKEGHAHYSVFSLWDTYRTLHPFLTLFYPSRQTDMVNSMLAMYKQNGWLPQWELTSSETYVMVGDPAVPAIADTWLNGLHSFDADLAYRAMLHESMDTSGVNPIRRGLKAYLKKHYIPLHTKGVGGALSTTLEYNFADYALAQFGKATGHTKYVASLLKRSKYYKNLYDSSTGFLRPKTADGQWYSPFNPATKDVHTPGFVEGNAWSYLFFVPHDPYGLAKLMGGRDQYIKRLQKSIDEGYFVMWNEPDMAYPYLFTYFDGASWRTQKAVRQTMSKAFTDGPGGLPGNDDCGTTSAWYVFSALGFYPANPASGNFRLGSPIFDQVTIHLNQKYYDGKAFTIKAVNASNKNIYIQSATWNGQPYHKPYIIHQMIEGGGTLVLHMGPKPDKNR